MSTLSTSPGSAGLIESERNHVRVAHGQTAESRAPSVPAGGVRR